MSAGILKMNSKILRLLDAFRIEEGARASNLQPIQIRLPEAVAQVCAQLLQSVAVIREDEAPPQ
jgi:hypothetical protein